MRSAAALTALVVATLFTSCSRSDEKAKTADAQPRAVRIARVATRPMERVLSVSGTLAADEQAVLSVKVPGRIERVEADLGSVVKRGALIAQIERRDYELKLQQALATLARARASLGLPLEGDDDHFESAQTSVVREARALLDEATHNRERVKNLSTSGISSQAEVDTVEAAYHVALNRFESAREEVRRRQADLAQRRAEFEIARQQLDDTAIRAPFDGAVQVRNANVGEFLSIGAPIATFVRTDPLRLRLEIPERKSLGVQPGQAVRVRVEENERVYTGVLSRLSPGITDASRVLMVEADIANDGTLRPGLFASAEVILREREPGLAIPLDALIVFAGLEKVVLVNDGKALEKTLATGRRGSDWIEVLSGLKPGDVVVLKPGNLRTGEPVTASESAPKEPGVANSGP